MGRAVGGLDGGGSTYTFRLLKKADGTTMRLATVTRRGMDLGSRCSGMRRCRGADVAEGHQWVGGRGGCG